MGFRMGLAILYEIRKGAALSAYCIVFLKQVGKICLILYDF
jgi:hypothetical protein